MTDHEENRRKLLFDLDRSIRYFDRRDAFFSGCNRLILTIGLLSYTVDAILLGHTFFDIPWTGFTAVVFVLGIGFGTTKKAYQYQILKHRAYEIEIFLKGQESTPEILKYAECQWLRVEKDEPPVKHALYALCHNEVVNAWGLGTEHLAEVERWERLLAQFFSLPNDKKLSDLAQKKPPSQGK